MLKALVIFLSVFNTVLVPVQFRDKELDTPSSRIESMALDCAGYFSAQYHGETYYSISVSETVTLDQDFSFYGHNYGAEIDPNISSLVREACLKAKHSVHFRKFCNGSEATVDLVIFLVAGYSEADGGGTDCCWPQFTTLSSKGETLQLDGCTIDNFIICPELSLPSASGTLCHEFGHFIGFPDFYDTDRNGSGGMAKDALGNLSIMDSGYLVNDAGLLPPFTAIEREIAGTGHRIEMVPGSYSLTANFDYLKLCGADKDEYYLLEYNPLSPGDGLQAYYVNKSSQNAGYSDHKGRTLTAGERWEMNEINCNPDYLCACRSTRSFVFSGIWQSPLVITDIRTGNDRMELTVSEALRIKDFRPYQDGAAIRFSIEEAASAVSDCTIEWYQEGLIMAIQRPAVIDGDMVATLDGVLDPSKDCSYLIKVESEHYTHFSFERGFSTSWWQKDGIPFITFDTQDRNPGGSFIKGSLIPLKVWNMPGQQGTEWYFNGRQIKDGWLKINESGELRANVKNPDGSIQVIVKQIIAE